jgi:hypothetical protein
MLLFQVKICKIKVKKWLKDCYSIYGLYYHSLMQQIKMQCKLDGNISCGSCLYHTIDCPSSVLPLGLERLIVGVGVSMIWVFVCSWTGDTSDLGLCFVNSYFKCTLL